jgi:dienelactone hydrolase
MLFFPVLRGYAGSEGPGPGTTFAQDPVAFLHRRGDDTNAGVEWLKTRSDVNPACIVNMGWSQGGMTTFLASGERPFLHRATVVQAPATSAGLNSTVGLEDVLRAARRIPTPILVQANTDDVDSFIEGNRVFVRELRRWGRSVEYKEYTDPNRHFVFEISVTPASRTVRSCSVFGNRIPRALSNRPSRVRPVSGSSTARRDAVEHSTFHG